jgi:hypothetical protein
MATPNGFINRFRDWLQAPMDVQVVFEIAADYVAGLRRQNGTVHAWALRELPAGAVRPAPLSDNIFDSPAIETALSQVAEAVTDKQTRCALLVPDLVARIAVIELEQVPGRPEEAEELLRWRLRKDVPFDVSQAVLSYHLQPGRTTAYEAVVVVALRSLIQQYEECVQRAGLSAGRVNLSTLATVHCLDSPSSTPSLLVKRDKVSLSLAIAHSGALRLFRSLPLPVGSVGAGEGTLFEKIYPAAVYFHDQWGQPIGEIVISGLQQLQPALVGRLEKEAECRTVELRTADFDLPSSNLPGSDPDYRILPSVGWLREEAQ